MVEKTLELVLRDLKTVLVHQKQSEKTFIIKKLVLN